MMKVCVNRTHQNRSKFIDRGGLWFVSDCTYLVFYAMEKRLDFT